MSAPRCFELRRVLGQGTFGHVYLADLTSAGGFRKTVALKVLNPQMAHSSDAAQRLRDEARVLGLLRHRHIVAVDDLVRVEGRWAMVMEFVPGQDLEALLAQEGLEEGKKLPLRAAGQIVAAVASALDAAWNDSFSGSSPLRVIHRDIKPSNIRITRDGQVKVLDFGIARGEFQEREARTTEIRYGSIPYMSPERLLGEDDTPACDVYALGSVFQELLTGKGTGRAELGPDRHEAQRLGVLDRVVAEVGADSWAVELIGATLNYEPDERPTAGELRERLQHHLDETGGVRLERWCSEHVPPEPVGATDRLLGKVFTEESGTAPVTGALDESATHAFAGPPGSGAPTIIPGVATGVVGDDGPPPWQPKASPPVQEERGSLPIGLIAGVVGALVALGVGSFVLSGGLDAEVSPAPLTASAAPSEDPKPDPVGAATEPGAEVVAARASTEGPSAPGSGEEAASGSASSTASAAETTGTVSPGPSSTKTRTSSKAVSSGTASGSRAGSGSTSGSATASEPASASTTTTATQGEGTAAEAQPAPTLRAVKFAVEDAQAVKVVCGGVSASGASSALVRNLPAGTCTVRAEVAGEDLSTSVEVSQPRGYTCTASGGSLSCR